MKSFLSKNKLWVLGFGYLLIGAAFVLYFMIPAIEKIQENADKIQEKVLEKEILERRLSQIPKMKNQEEGFLGVENQIGKTMMSSEEVVFLQYLESLAQETGNSIEINIPDEELNNEKNKKKSASLIEGGEEIVGNMKNSDFIVLEVTLSSNFNSAIKFINKLENSSYYLNIINFDMKRMEKDKGANYAQAIFSPSVSEEESLKVKNYLKTNLKIIVYQNGY